MSTEANERAELTEALRALRAEVARLGDRVAALEATAARPTAAPPVAAPVAAPPAEPPRPAEPIPDEVLLVISAAVAAFLGKRAPLRQVRISASGSWAHQGRVSIQASHAFARSGAQS